MKRRKYRIAALLAQYDEKTARQKRDELAEALGIRWQMMNRYINVSEEETRLCNLSIHQVDTIATYFGVTRDEVLQDKVMERESV
jgi:hypothetical protein